MHKLKNRRIQKGARKNGPIYAKKASSNEWSDLTVLEWEKMSESGWRNLDEFGEMIDSGYVFYNPNDPTTTEDTLIEVEITPSDIAWLSNHGVTVSNYPGTGTEYSYNSIYGRTSNCVVACITTLAEITIHHKMSVVVHPEVNLGSLNAYYSRANGLCLGYDRKGETTWHESSSGETISHELGHAILDNWRSDLWESPLFEVSAYHEAFADLSTVLAYQYYIQARNQIDPDQTNFMSTQCEFESAFYDDPTMLRELNSVFTYTQDDGGDPHTKSMCFSTAMYEIFKNIYDLEGSDDEAMVTARDVVNYFIQISREAPSGNTMLASAAQLVMAESQTAYSGNYETIVTNAFTTRNFPTLSMAFANPYHKLARDKVVIRKNKKHITRKEYKMAKFNNMDIRVPRTEYFQFIDNELIFHSSEDWDTVMNDAERFVNYLTKNNLIGDGHQHSHKTVETDGLRYLLRTKFMAL
jgi:hypothetical protein